VSGAGLDLEGFVAALEARALQVEPEGAREVALGRHLREHGALGAVADERAQARHDRLPV